MKAKIVRLRVRNNNYVHWGRKGSATSGKKANKKNKHVRFKSLKRKTPKCFQKKINTILRCKI